jgi:hypothetical protein
MIKDQVQTKQCEVHDHDWKHLIRKGRASYICPGCDQNVMLLLVLMSDAGVDLNELLSK